ncbi:MAG: sterol desaturase family protein [Rhodospirillales bacterium]
MLDKIELALEKTLAKAGDRLTDWTAYPFLEKPEDLFYSGWIASFVVIAVIIHLARAQSGERTFGGFVRAVFPKAVYAHPSAIVDYKYYVVNRIFVRIAFIASVAAAFAVVGTAWAAVLGALFGAEGPRLEPGLALGGLYVVGLLLAADLGFYLAHLASHKIPLLWEFHKVHHSAEVLTPFTNYRFHPVEMVLIDVSKTVFVGLVNGTFGYLTGSGVTALMVFDTVIVLYAFNVLGNLRHSHIWLSYGPVLGKVLCSPAMHQLHHGTDPKHIDRNYSLVFSLWDWIGGTMYMPPKAERIDCGLGVESREFRSVWALYTLPFVKAARLYSGRGAMSRRKSA